MKRLILIFTLLLTISLSAQSSEVLLLMDSDGVVDWYETHNIWYVDRDATGNADGTSWTDAEVDLSDVFANAISAGDTIYISGGADSTTYTADVISNKDYASFVTVTKSWEANHNGMVYFASTEGDQYTLQVNYCSYIQFDSLHFVWDTDVGVDSLINYASFHPMYSKNIWLSRCRIISNGRAFSITTGENTGGHLFTDNYMEILPNNYHIGQDNMQIVEGEGGHTITGNTMIQGGLNNSPIAAHHDHIQFVDEGGTSGSETIIANNLFIFISDSGAANSISIQQPRSQRYLIYNNIIAAYSRGMGGIWFGGENSGYENEYDQSLRILNNTIITTRTTWANAVGVTICDAGAYGYPDTLIIKNNIMVNGYHESIIIGDGVIDLMDSIDIDYNHYYNAGQAVVFYANSGYLNFAQWQGLGYDANGNEGAVTFVDDSSSTINDYITTTGRDLGIDLSTYFTTDINGYIRPYNSVWDMGCIEYNIIDTVGLYALLWDLDTQNWWTLEKVTKDANNKVTSWTDSSGAYNNGLQADTSKSPTWSSTGVLFDGVNDFVRASSSMDVPVTVYMVFRSVTYTNLDIIMGGATSNVVVFRQYDTAPSLSIYAGVGLGDNDDLAVGDWGIATVIFNGANSSLQINSGTPLTGNTGAETVLNGITVGSGQDGTGNWSNIEVKEVITRVWNDSEAQQNLIRAYLNDRYSIY